MAAMGVIGPEGRRQLQLAARFATAGLELVIAILVGYFGGRFIDRWLDTEPVGGYVGLILGIIAGFRNLFLLARSSQASAASREPPAPSSDHREEDPKP
jgi:ATP synthase protein I